MRLNEETYFLRYKDFLEESKVSELEPDQGDELAKSEELESRETEEIKKIKKAGRNSKIKVSFPKKIIQDTLTPKEKKKREREERSDQRKRSWGVSGDINTEPEGYKALKSLSRGITEKKKTKKKKTKPDCVPGGKWHDENGRFSSKSDAKSWAGGYEHSNRTDCKAGKFKTTGDGRKKITKHRCGRSEDGSKEEFKCKDSQPYWKLDEEYISGERELAGYSSSELVEELINRLEENRSTEHILKLCSAINQSAKGDFPPKPR